MPGRPGLQDHNVGQSGCRVPHPYSPSRDGPGVGSEAVVRSSSVSLLAILGIHLLQDSDFYFSTSGVCDYF